MTDRENLVELIDHVAEGHIVNLMQPGGAEALADHFVVFVGVIVFVYFGIEVAVRIISTILQWL